MSAHLTYTIGGTLGGSTRVVLDDQGHCRVESSVTADRTRRTFEAEVGPARLGELLDLFDAAGLWQVENAEPPGPGEGIAQFALVEGDRERSVRLGVSAIPDCEPFATATEAILRLAREVSGGAVLEPGR